MKNLLIITAMFFALSCSSQTQQKSMKLIYVYDPICGWCYGFSGVITEFYDHHKDSLDVEVVSGGMIRGSRVGPATDMASYIRGAYQRVEQMSGIKFGDAFLNGTLNNEKIRFNSVPPSIAMSVFKSLKPSEAVYFAAAIQRAIYLDGLDPEDVQHYGKIAAAFGLDADAFIQSMHDPAFSQKAEQDFARSSQLGVNGFPTVFLETASGLQVLSRGFVNLQQLEDRFLTINH